WVATGCQPPRRVVTCALGNCPNEWSGRRWSGQCDGVNARAFQALKQATDSEDVQLQGYTFSRLLHESPTSLIYAGARDADGVSAVAKVFSGGHRSSAHEHRMLQKVAGPGVAEALGLFEHDGQLVLVQRRFGTMSLADALRDGRFPVERVLHIGLKLARVL